MLYNCLVEPGEGSNLSLPLPPKSLVTPLPPSTGSIKGLAWDNPGKVCAAHTRPSREAECLLGETETAPSPCNGGLGGAHIDFGYGQRLCLIQQHTPFTHDTHSTDTHMTHHTYHYTHNTHTPYHTNHVHHTHAYTARTPLHTLPQKLKAEKISFERCRILTLSC